MDSGFVTYESVRPRTARPSAAHYWIAARDGELVDAVHRHARRTAQLSGVVQRLHYHDPATGCRDEVHEDIAA